LEAAVGVAAEGGQIESTISEGREGWWGVGGGKVGEEQGGASGAEEGALAAWLRAPGEEVGAVGWREMGDGAGGGGDAVRGEADGAGIRDDKKARGGKGRGADAEAAEDGGEVEETLGIGG
jgi:hypothetical protein